MFGKYSTLNMHYFFQSVTFTNGGMRYSLSNFRLAQTLLKTPIVGEVVNSLMCKLQAQGISRFFSGRQFASIWSPVSVMLFLKSSMHDRFPVFRPSLSNKVSMMITGGGNHTQRGSGLQEASGAGDAKVDSPGPMCSFPKFTQPKP